MVKLPLVNGEFTLVDDEDFQILKKYRWTAIKDRSVKSKEVYYVHATGPVEGSKSRLLHRIIMDPPKGKFIDHINGDTLDNRRSNLRIVTPRQNQQNKRIDQYSKYPGVTKDGKRWKAQIKINGKGTHLGCFGTEKEAFQAYKNAVHKFIGEKIICEL